MPSKVAENRPLTDLSYSSALAVSGQGSAGRSPSRVRGGPRMKQIKT